MVRVRAPDPPQLKASTPGIQRVHPEDDVLFNQRTYKYHSYTAEIEICYRGRPTKLTLGTEGCEVVAVIHNELTPIEGHMSLGGIAHPGYRDLVAELPRTLPLPPEGMALPQVTRKVDDAWPQLVVEEQTVA